MAKKKEEKVNEKEVKEESKLEQGLDDFIENMVQFFARLFNNVSEQKVSKLLITVLYAIIIMVVLGILLWFIRIPFEIAKEIGLSLINLGSDNVITDTFSVIWSLFIGITCLIVSVIIIAALVKKIIVYFDKNDNSFDINKIKSDVKPLATDIKEEIRRTENDKVVTSTLTILAKLFVIIFLYIPLIMAVMMSFVAFGGIIFFASQGLFSVGITLILTGKFLIVIALITLISRFIFNLGGQQIRNYLFTILIGGILIISGIGFFVTEIMDYNYVNGLPASVVKSTRTFTYNLNDENLYINSGDIDAAIISDEKITVGTVTVEATYYSDINRLNVSERAILRGNVVKYSTTFEMNSPKYFYQFTVDSLKDKKVYNYDMFDDVTVKVYVNPHDLALVKDYNRLAIDNFYISDETIICASALEEIARDVDYVYYLDCIKSSTVFLVYPDGTKISVRRALDTHKVTIYELIEAGLTVYKEPINPSL